MIDLPKDELFAQGHNACAGCGASIVARHALKAAGPNVIVVNATGCLEVFSTFYPETSWRVPWIHGAFENAAAIASGVVRALKKQGKSDEIKVLAMGGDGGTFDIGLQALSGAVERGEDFCYICYDNMAYMNTGIQRSGSTDKYGATTTSPAGKKIHGKQEFKKNMPFIIAAHENAYVATANIAFPDDFIRKVKKGLDFKGPAYIQVFAPCPTGWKHIPSLSIQMAKLAHNTCFYPMYEIENGILTITRKPSNKRPVKDYLQEQGRFKHMNEQEIAEVQKHVDDEWDKLCKLEETKVRI